MGSIAASARPLYLLTIAVCLGSLAAGCSGDATSLAGDYIECPEGWQPGSDGETCSPICSAGTVLNATENGCIPEDGPPTTPVIDTEDVSSPPPEDVSDGPGPVGVDGGGDDPGYLDCPTGWQPNSSGEGCAPVCAAGTELNEDENGCVPVPDDDPGRQAGEDVTASVDTTGNPESDAGPVPPPADCPAGYEATEMDGSTVCVPVTEITVHGYVLDEATAMGIANATVTINGLSDAPLVTDGTGYFEISGVTQIGNFAIYYSAPGYHSHYGWVTVASAASYGGGEVFIDATAWLTWVEEEPVEPPPVADGWIAGTVYAGDSAAADATVRLHDNSTGDEVAVTTTDLNGDFFIENIVTEGQTFDLLVDSYDADDDGVFDFQGQSIDVGTINEGTTAVNTSNVVVVLTAVGKSLSYVNFTPPLEDVAGPGLYSGLQFASSGGNLLFHFGAETLVDTLTVSLVERVGGVVVETIGVVSTWNPKGTVLTVNPSSLLTQDADPSTDYELRIESLLWADGSAFVPLAAGVAGAARFQFQVGEAPTYLTNPAPTLYTDNLDTDEQEVSLVSCDARVCWLLDTDGYPLGGFVDPSTNAASEAHINSTDGFQLTWAPVVGATQYRIYARQSYDGPEAAGLQGWVELSASSIVTGNFSAGAATTVYATGILATGSPVWSDFGAGGAPGVGNTLAFGNVVEIAVTAIDAQGLESPINESKTYALIDVTKAGIVSANEVDPDAETTQTYDAITSFDVRFSELIQPGSTATWALTSNRLLSMSQPEETIWGNDDVFSGDNVSEEGSFERIQVETRTPCATLLEDADATATKVRVNDVSLFPSGEGIEVTFLRGDNGGQLAHPGVRNVFSSNAGTGEIEFFNPLEANGGNGLSEGDFVCVVLAQSGLSVSGGALINGVSTPVASTEPVHLFHLNQPIVVLNKKQVEEGVFSISVYETTVTGVQRPKYDDEFILQLGHLYLGGSPPENFASSTIFARPTHQTNFRHVTEMRLTQDVSSTPLDPDLVEVQVIPGTMMGSNAMPGDLLLIDVDGDLDTVSDRHFAIIDYLDSRLDDPVTDAIDETDYRVGLVAAGNNSTALPTTISLDADDTRIICLGDSFKLSGLQDTSSNFGLNAYRDEFTFCDGGFPECKDGLFIY